MSIDISVITPMYNSEIFLKQCIESFLRQSIMTQSEMILVDDCSPDHSAEIARGYEKQYPENVRVIGYEKNRRAGGARNYGLGASKGKYVLFLDADDWLDEHALEKLYHVAEEGGLDIVDCDYYAVDSRHNDSLEYQISMSDKSVGVQNIEKRSLNIVNGGRIFTKLFLKQYLISNKYLYPENLKFEDNGIGPVICYMAGTIGKVDEALYYYRVGNASSQTGQFYNQDSMFNRMESSRYLLETAKRIGALDECYDAVAYRFAELFYASNLYIYVRGQFELPIKVLRDMRAEFKSYFPDYKRARYYMKLSKRYRLCCDINDISPVATKAFRKIFKVTYSIYKQVRK